MDHYLADGRGYKKSVRNDPQIANISPSLEGNLSLTKAKTLQTFTILTPSNLDWTLLQVSQLQQNMRRE
jgi:hypothetical protein